MGIYENDPSRRLIQLGVSEETLDDLRSAVGDLVSCKTTDELLHNRMIGIMERAISEAEGAAIDRKIDYESSRGMICMSCGWKGSAADLVSINEPAVLGIDHRYCPECKSVRIADDA